MYGITSQVPRPAFKKPRDTICSRIFVAHCEAALIRTIGIMHLLEKTPPAPSHHFLKTPLFFIYETRHNAERNENTVKR
jgi:hypothetical protein